MDEGARAGGAPVTGDAANGSRSPETIRRDIEQTREQVAATAAALAEKADVKARAHDKVEETKARITGRVGAARRHAGGATPSSVAAGAATAGDRAREHPVPVAVVAGLAAGLLIGWLVASRRRIA